jgi:hypothetical protein
MRPAPSSDPIAELVRLHGELDHLDRFGCDPAPSDAADPVLALATVERMRGELAKVRASISAPLAPLSIGERAAASHHVQVIAASLGILQKAYRKISSGPVGRSAMDKPSQPPRHTAECDCDTCKEFGQGVYGQLAALAGDSSAKARLTPAVYGFLIRQRTARRQGAARGR